MSKDQKHILFHQTKEIQQNTAIGIKKKKILLSNELGLDEQKQVILYSGNDGKISIKVFFAKDNFWLTQKTMAELFGVNLPAISKHLKNIYASKELIEETTISKMEIVQLEGKRKITRSLDVYNLDAVIAVGYRVNSIKATHFRIWATNSLRELIVKGFVLNDDMLKNGRIFGKDYFDELLEIIRDIRASERRAYQKIADIFEQCSSDYQSLSEETQLFYKIIQNQLHFATTGKTAAEIIYQRANSKKTVYGVNYMEKITQRKNFKK